jgi:hypothetical protein
MKTTALRMVSYVLITLLTALAAAAQNGNQPPLPVKVTNTDPIPVSGTVTVNSSSSTPLTVTGNVNVAGQVTVANAANTTLNVRDLNNVQKTPIQLFGSCNATDPLGCGRVINYSVPNGKFLVVEYISTRYSGPTGSRGQAVAQSCMPDNICFKVFGPGDVADFRPRSYLEPTGIAGLWSGDTQHAGASQAVKIYANNNTAFTVYGQCSPAGTCSDSFSMEVTVSGYLIDKP